MSAILVFIIVVSILVFWNIDAYVRKKNRFPIVREIFELHVREQDYRAYRFFIFFAIIMLCVFMYTIYTSSQYFEWLSTYFKDVVLVMLFVFGLINYIFRMYVTSILYREDYLGNIIYVWDVWSIGIKHCVSLRQKIILGFLNAFIFILIIIYFFY